MGNKIVDSLFGKKPQAVTTQNVARLGKVAHELHSSKNANKDKYTGACLLGFDDRGEVYIRPAKFNKKTQQIRKQDLREHEKALKYLDDHFRDHANLITYGRNKHGQYNAVLARMGINKLKGAFTLNQLSAELRPVSMHEQCASARKQSEDVINRVKSMAGSPDACHADGAYSNGRPARVPPSAAYVAADEAGAVLRRALQNWVPKTTKDREAFDERLQQVAKLDSMPIANPEAIGLDTLQDEVLTKPNRDIDELLRQWDQLWDGTYANFNWTGDVYDQKRKRVCESLKHKIEEAIVHRAQVGSWIANKLAPSLPGQLGESAKMQGIAWVQLAADDLSNGSALMSLYRWAGRNIEEAQRRMEARVVERAAIGLANVADSLTPWGGASNAGTAFTQEQLDAAKQAYEAANANAVKLGDRALDWIAYGDLESYQGVPDGQLGVHLGAAWAPMVQGLEKPEQGPFKLLHTSLPAELKQLADDLDALALRMNDPANAQDKRLRKAVVKLAARIGSRTALYQKYAADMGRIMAAEAQRIGYSKHLQKDCIDMARGWQELARAIADPASPVMKTVAKAGQQSLLAMKQWGEIQQRDLQVPPAPVDAQPVAPKAQPEPVQPAKKSATVSAQTLRRQSAPASPRQPKPSKDEDQFYQRIEAILDGLMDDADADIDKLKVKPRSRSGAPSNPGPVITSDQLLAELAELMPDSARKPAPDGSKPGPKPIEAVERTETESLDLGEASLPVEEAQRLMAQIFEETQQTEPPIAPKAFVPGKVEHTKPGDDRTLTERVERIGVRRQRHPASETERLQQLSTSEFEPRMETVEVVPKQGSSNPSIELPTVALRDRKHRRSVSQLAREPDSRVQFDRELQNSPNLRFDLSLANLMSSEQGHEPPGRTQGSGASEQSPAPQTDDMSELDEMFASMSAELGDAGERLDDTEDVSADSTSPATVVPAPTPVQEPKVVALSKYGIPYPEGEDMDFDNDFAGAVDVWNEKVRKQQAAQNKPINKALAGVRNAFKRDR